ncbi:MAG: LLM class F420-dependent oxidoreductase [Actinobacteria bacterium]|nr:LLM class F420-dependent oxidoreductase [Actinomycetota bacterium]
MSEPRRHGITVPFPGVALHDHRGWYEECVALGYTDVWSAEAGSHDGLVPLTLAAAWTPQLRLGTAILPVYTRGAATLAGAVASMCQAAPGRFALGIGASSPTIVTNWNAVPFEKPYARVRDTIRFLRAALAGEKVSEDYETFSVKGFRLDVAVPEMPPILVGALRPQMLRLAGREGDGAITNWCSPDDVRTIAEQVGADRELVCRIMVLPTTDRDTLRMVGRRMVAAYMTVPAYAAFQEWLGRGDAIRPMNERWAAGDRAGALEEIPDTLLDELIVHGTPEECRRRVEEYAAAGITTTAPAVFATGDDLRTMIRALAPGAA